MFAKITFEGPLPFIESLVSYAAELHEEYLQGEATILVPPAQNAPAGNVVQFQPQGNPATAVPPASAPKTRVRETAAHKKERLEKEALAAAPAVEPNAAANAAIAQQSQWAQQPTQPSYPQQAGGFPAAAVNTTPAASFPAQAVAQPGVGAAGQAWLAPQAVNAAPGPTLENVYQLLSQIAQDNTKRALFQSWIYARQIPALEALKDQSAMLAEAYGVVSKIISGEIAQPFI